MTIGERIRDRRLRLRLSADELAEILGKNRATIYRYESNDIENLPASIIVPLAKVLNCSPAYLMGWTEVENSQLECTPKEQNLINNYRQLNATGQTKVDEYVSDLVDGGKYAETNTIGKSHLLLVGKGGSADVEIKDPKGLDEEVEKLKRKHGLK